jgi:hypothetical protein
MLSSCDSTRVLIGYSTPEQFAVQVQKDGFNTAKAAKHAGEKPLRTLLERLSGEKLNA